MAVRRLKTSGRGDAVDFAVAGNRVRLLHEPEVCLPAMLDAIAHAEREILLEMYWFASDHTGWRFANALMERAQSGVVVRVIYDAVGSLTADDALFAAMAVAGCRVAQYNPVAPWRHRFHAASVNNRDHRKMLVVDGRVALTGGVNIGDEWAAVDAGGEGWRDDVIEVEGPVVAQFRATFGLTWRELTDEPLGVLEPSAAEVLLAPAVTDAAPPGSSPALSTPATTTVRVLANHYRDERKAIRQAYLDRIRRARRYFYVTNSYFLPDRRVRRALCAAARRGVDVRVLVPAASDVPAVDLASRHHWDRLLRAGVRIYRWHGPILHAKSAVSDDLWTTVGSFNLDNRSWLTNLELNVAVEDDALAVAMRDRVLADLASATEVDRDTHRRRPLWVKLLEWLFSLGSRLL